MKFLVLAIFLFASAVSAAEVPDPALETLKLQISNLQKDLRIYELSYNAAKTELDKLITEYERRVPKEKPEGKK